jgi:hypothetical protein
LPHARPRPAALESRLNALLLEFDRLQDAWPKGRNEVERAELGKRYEDTLTEI